MNLSYFIYLTYNLHDKNISGMISGQGQMWAKFKNSEQKI